MAELIDAWLSANDSMMILNEDKLEQVQAEMNEMGIATPFRRLTKREYLNQIKEYKWEKELEVYYKVKEKVEGNEEA